MARPRKPKTKLMRVDREFEDMLKRTKSEMGACGFHDAAITDMTRVLKQSIPPAQEMIKQIKKMH